MEHTRNTKQIIIIKSALNVDLTPISILVLLRTQRHIGEEHRLRVDDVWHWSFMFLLCTVTLASESATDKGGEKGESRGR